MLLRTFPRTDEWRAKVSRKIRDKWAEPDYRQAVIVGIQNSNKTFSVHRLRSPRQVSDVCRLLSLEYYLHVTYYLTPLPPPFTILIILILLSNPSLQPSPPPPPLLPPPSPESRVMSVT